MNRNCKLLFACLLCATTGCRQTLRIESIKEIKDYSAGSAMAFFRGRIYLMGDDMNYLYVTDPFFNRVDTMQLEAGSGRIPKNIKSDLEAASILRLKKSSYLLLLGSGSAYPYRNNGWIINLYTRQKAAINLDFFYRRIQANGIKALNIEGAASIPGGMILSSRGNKSYPKNSLIFTSAEFWNRQQTADIKIMKVGSSNDTASFSGVSGMDYSYKSDCLLLTVSTENTYSVQTDGDIGKSYLWLIDNISSKKRLAAVNPNRIIDLESLDDRFKKHKIESVCIISENKNSYQLALVADDDKGTSLLFKIDLNKKE